MRQPESPVGFHGGFAAALLDPAQPVPAAIAQQPGASRATRFAIHRNNVVVGLIDALAARFPVTRQLVGDEFFQAMAREFVRGSPPRDPVLWHYGATLPEFIAVFRPAAGLPWLPDVARLERAWSEAWAAAEAAALAAEALVGLDAGQLLTATAALHPATRLLRAAHPAGSIWSVHQQGQTPRAPEHWVPEDLLVTRPGAEVQVRILPPGAFAGLAALAAGASLEAALQACASAAPGTDPATLLTLALDAGALVSLRCEAAQTPPPAAMDWAATD